MKVKIVRKPGRAVVDYDASRISPDKIVAAITRAGYPASLAVRPPAPAPAR